MTRSSITNEAENAQSTQLGGLNQMPVRVCRRPLCLTISVATCGLSRQPFDSKTGITPARLKDTEQTVMEYSALLARASREYDRRFH